MREGRTTADADEVSSAFARQEITTRATARRVRVLDHILVMLSLLRFTGLEVRMGHTGGLAFDIFEVTINYGVTLSYVVYLCEQSGDE